MSFASIIVMGRIGEDPKTTRTPNGAEITSFSIAVDDGWGSNKKTFWYRCKAFKRNGENIAQHFKKGDGILVRGTPEIWQNPNNPQSKGMTVLVWEWSFVPGRRAQQEAPAPAPQPDFEDEIPF